MRLPLINKPNYRIRVTKPVLYRYFAFLAVSIISLMVLACNNGVEKVNKDDLTKPITTVSPRGGLYNSPQTITLSCIDTGSKGCDKTYYAINKDDSFTEIDARNQNIIIDSTSTVSFYSIDTHGNVEDKKTELYIIDSQLPVTGSILEFSEVTSSSIKVSWNIANDNVTDPKNLEYQLYSSVSNNLDTVENVLNNGIPAAPPTNNINSIVVNNLNNAQLYYWNVLVTDQAGNKAAYTESSHATLAKGIFDVLFADNGQLVGHDGGYGSSIEILGDNIFVAGINNDAALWRYDLSGNLDQSFGQNGLLNFGGEGVTSIALSHTSKIILGGAAVWQVDPTIQSLDTEFGPNSDGMFTDLNAAGGNVSLDIVRSMVVDNSGNIVLTGGSVNSSNNYDMVIWRLTPTGKLDSAFGPSGQGYFVHNNAGGGDDMDIGRSTNIDTQGKILVVGESNNGLDYDMIIWRYDPATNSLDSNFANGGVFSHHNAAGGNGNDRAFSVVANERQIFVVGDSYNGADYDTVIWCYDLNTNRLDPSFANNGIFVFDSANGGTSDDHAYFVAFDNNANLVIAGSSHKNQTTVATIWRFNLEENSLDSAFAINGVFTSNSIPSDSYYSQARAVKVDNNGGIYVMGVEYDNSQRNFFVWRIN